MRSTCTRNSPATTDLLVWCLDLQDILHVPYTFQEHTLGAGQNLPGLPAGGLDGTQLRQIASLMFKGLLLAGANSLQDDAATQLAIWKVEYGGGVSFAGLSAALQSQLDLELADSVAGGILDCPTCTLTALTDAINAPNQALGFATQSVAVPGPVAGAGLPGLVMALGLLALRHRRRNAAA